MYTHEKEKKAFLKPER